MGDEWIEIYDGRLDATEAEIVAYLESDLGKPDLRLPDLGRAPDPGFFEYSFTFAKAADLTGKAAVEMRQELQEALAKKELGILYLQRFWEGAKWIHLGAYHESTGPFGYREFYSGHLELSRTYTKKDKPTNVAIVSGWPTLRPYWQWVADCLRRRFKEKRKGGPRETLIDKQKRVVLGWRAVIGDMTQAAYCAKQGIDPRTLQNWENKLEAAKMIPKHKRR
jgi:hypothetical protein